MFRKGKIPPPLTPVLPEASDEDPYEIDIPFELGEQPRVFLHFLANNTKLDEDGKALIREWLEKYDYTLSEWVLGAYGFMGWMRANQLAAHVQTQFYAAAKGAVDAAENEFFDYLEREMGDGPTDTAQNG